MRVTNWWRPTDYCNKLAKATQMSRQTDSEFQNCECSADCGTFVRTQFGRNHLIMSIIHRMQIWRTTRPSPGTSHESEASEASVFCFDNASPEKSCFVDGLVCFISLCLLVFVFLNISRRDRNCPTFASTGKQWIHGIRWDEGSE